MEMDCSQLEPDIVVTMEPSLQPEILSGEADNHKVSVGYNCSGGIAENVTTTVSSFKANMCVPVPRYTCTCFEWVIWSYMEIYYYKEVSYRILVSNKLNIRSPHDVQYTIQYCNNYYSLVFSSQKLSMLDFNQKPICRTCTVAIKGGVVQRDVKTIIEKKAAHESKQAVEVMTVNRTHFLNAALRLSPGVPAKPREHEQTKMSCCVLITAVRK